MISCSGWVASSRVANISFQATSSPIANGLPQHSNSQPGMCTGTTSSAVMGSGSGP